MAKFDPSVGSKCSNCSMPFTLVNYDAEYGISGVTYCGKNPIYRKTCMCLEVTSGNLGSTALTNYVQEPKVTKQYDTTTNKSAALNVVQDSITKLERAMFNRAEARAALEVEHRKLIHNASAYLDRALMEGLHLGMDADDYAQHISLHHADLERRCERLLQVIQLDSTVTGV